MNTDIIKQFARTVSGILLFAILAIPMCLIGGLLNKANIKWNKNDFKNNEL